MTESVYSIQTTGERNIGNVVKDIGNNMREKCKSKQKFGGAKVFKTEQVRKYFVNPKTENEVFSQYVNYIICSLDFRNTEEVVRTILVIIFLNFTIFQHRPDSPQVK